MIRQHPVEKIISKDGKMEFSLGQLIEIYNSLKIERVPNQNHHIRNWDDKTAQYWPLVQDPIISFSSKSLVLALNNEQICKIRVDGNANSEIHNIEFVRNKTKLFPEVYFIIDLPYNLKGIIMERIPIMDKYNFSSGELNRFYYDFKDELKFLHDLGFIHNDLRQGKSSTIRPNIIISKDKIRLLDFESIKIKSQTENWKELLENEEIEMEKIFYELIDFACCTLT